MNVILNKLKLMTYKQILLYIIIVLCFTASIWFVNHNDTFYKRDIAKVIQVHLEGPIKVTDSSHNVDHVFTQRITAEIMNGKDKGKLILLTNEYSSSGAYDQAYSIGNELFVSINKPSTDQGDLTGVILDVKRDRYVLPIAWIFVFALLIVGKKRGLLTLLSLAVNAALMSYGLEVYENHANLSLLWICGLSVILFTILTLIIVNGLNAKTCTAILATLLGTFLSLLIANEAMRLTSDNGLVFEGMQFLTPPDYQIVFMAGLFVGSLGAVMDVAITIASAVFGLYEQNPGITVKALQSSGLDIGRDIMGTFTNILFFVYISGSIPAIILYLKNANPLSYTLSMNLSLEFARALAGGIGIVLTIPISLYMAIFFISRKRARS